MSDPKKPPPRFPRPESPELVRIGEEEPTPTERVPVPLPPPQMLGAKPGAKPVDLKVLRGRESSYVELSAQLSTTQTTLGGVAASQTELLAVQRKMALQVDGLGRAMNTRFDLFHKELSLLRAVVVGDHAPRLDAVEPRLDAVEKTTVQKAAVAAKGTGLSALLVIGLPLLSQLLPQYGSVISAISRWVGLQ